MLNFQKYIRPPSWKCSKSWLTEGYWGELVIFDNTCDVNFGWVNWQSKSWLVIKSYSFTIFNSFRVYFWFKNVCGKFHLSDFTYTDRVTAAVKWNIWAKPNFQFFPFLKFSFNISKSFWCIFNQPFAVFDLAAAGLPQIPFTHIKLLLSIFLATERYPWGIQRILWDLDNIIKP